MKQRVFSSMIITVLFAVLVIGCKETPAEKTSFGKVDPLSDGQVLTVKDNAYKNIKSVAGMDEKIGKQHDDHITTAKQLDTADLPPEVIRMSQLCDAINMASVELRTRYNPDNSDFVWHCVHIFLIGCEDDDFAVREVGDFIDVDPEVVEDTVYAMFGNLGSVPEMSVTADEDGNSHMNISTDMKYRFSMGDRGSSEPKIKKVTQYSDGSMEMEVELADSETGREIVDFTYKMRSNSRNTESDALFAYEIISAEAADSTTASRMNGKPFLTPVIQVYSGEVQEILTFNAFSDHVPGMDDLNGRISSELIDFAQGGDPEGKRRNVYSYPVNPTGYVQFAAIFGEEDGTYDIRCYNYDINKRRALSGDDAFTMCEMTQRDVTAAFLSEYEKDHPDDPATDTVYKGFLVKSDGSLDLFFSVTGSEGAKIVSYNSYDGTIRDDILQNGAVPPEEEDVMTPPLTHGREDK